ncbi:hypothetical protein GPECTOR_1g8 [Gonium pectorale]|uniref:Uncharacterized protein n=1 Tax=Gonium pectorale TaxID=33097 RepID=A0A150H443_GONPE|nr:hypothetical protein GPECTOR_1g8 [Gonium pectorale]|eukprot:KXZ56886.1 hypothetical protein GPECTOR_1g8 [Gonium pectorale]
MESCNGERCTPKPKAPSRARYGATPAGADASLRCVAVDSLPSPIRDLCPAGPDEAALPLVTDMECASPTQQRSPRGSSGGGGYSPCGDPYGRSASASSATPKDASANLSWSSSSSLTLNADSTGRRIDAPSGLAGMQPVPSEPACKERDNDTRAADTEPLLDTSAAVSDMPLVRPPYEAQAGAAAGDATAATAQSSGSGGRQASGLRARLRGWVARQDWPAMRRILAIGSTAGFISGVMSGMTGISGPPIMYMYEKLKVLKEVVRGTNAVNNVLQIKLVFYITMGIFKRSELPLYAVTSLVGMAGVGVGNLLAGRVDQRGFSRIMVGLMVICCCLLVMSAAGLNGH